LLAAGRLCLRFHHRSGRSRKDAPELPEPPQPTGLAFCPDPIGGIAVKPDASPSSVTLEASRLATILRAWTWFGASWNGHPFSR
jgi:hypothetical protein